MARGRGGSPLVYHDSCSEAGRRDGVPAWKVALSQQYVQMPGCRAPEFSKKQNPDGFRSLVKGNAARCVSGAEPHTCRASDTHLITHSMSCCHLLGEKKVFVIEALLWRGEALALFRHACGCQPVRRILIRSGKVKGRAQAQLRPGVTLETLYPHF